MIIVAAAALACGCEPLRRPGFPAQSHDDSQLITELEARFDLSAAIDHYYQIEAESHAGHADSSARESLRALRNSIISRRLTLLNLHYNRFIADASFNRQVMDLTADLADLGVDLAATVSGAATAKTLLSAVSAGITGAQASLHGNIYLDRTIAAIVTSMNARRKEALLPILRGMAAPAETYPLSLALSDLDNYYLAGTFVGGLDGIQQRAALAEREADRRIMSFTVTIAPQPATLIDDEP